MKSFGHTSFVAKLGIALSLLVALCFVQNSNAQTSTLYNGGYQQPSSVTKARVIAVRDVELNTNNGGNGQVIGQLLGGALGALLGQQSKNYAVAGVAGTLGTVLGGHLGNAYGNSQKSQELIVQFDDGKVSAITQSSTDGVRFSVGQPVMIIGQGRVVPAL